MRYIENLHKNIVPPARIVETAAAVTLDPICIRAALVRSNELGMPSCAAVTYICATWNTKSHVNPTLMQMQMELKNASSHPAIHNVPQTHAIIQPMHRSANILTIQLRLVTSKMTKTTANVEEMVMATVSLPM